MYRSYYLSLGSNIHPEDNLPAAVRLLANYGRIKAVSRVYESPPAGASEHQPNYLNAAVLLISNLSPLEFQTQAIGDIEVRLRRVRTDDRNAARTIDIDILLVDQQILHIEHRTIPSPEIYERDFVAVPLGEIAGETVHPETGERLSAIAANFENADSSLKPRRDVDLQGFEIE